MYTLRDSRRPGDGCWEHVGVEELGCHFGSKLGPFWFQVGGLGAILAPSWGVWAPSRGSWSILGSKLGVKLALICHFAEIAKTAGTLCFFKVLEGAMLRPSGAKLEPS